MDKEFLDNFFSDLEKELENKEFIEDLRNQIDELDKNELKKLIENYF